MRAAIAAAEVGDEQRGEDPTVRALEERVAALLGQEHAVFLPTATMANQIALRTLTVPGDELVATDDGHVFRYELGGAAVHSGLAMRPLGVSGGTFTPAELAAVVTPPGSHYSPPTRLVVIENTHNGSGGRIWPIGLLRDVVGEARRHGLVTHLDGARLLNASVASGVEPAVYGAPFDTATLCLSKGLGCPLGAVLAGSGELIATARRHKHGFGGAMRQAGIVAAAGLYALDHHVDRLADDHANARRLAAGLGAAGVAVDPGQVETNFVLIDVGAMGLAAVGALRRLEEAGVMLSAGAREGVLRAVTHLDVSARDIDRAVPAIAGALSGGRSLRSDGDDALDLGHALP